MWPEKTFMVGKQIQDQGPKGNQEIQIGGWDWETQI